MLEVSNGALSSIASVNDHHTKGSGMNDKHLRRTARLDTPTSLGSDARRDVSGALNALLADFFALYLKTKNFHWHVSGPHFRDYHLLLDEQADQLRSEERRVGKECRSRWAPDQEEKKKKEQE